MSFDEWILAILAVAALWYIVGHLNDIGASLQKLADDDYDR